MHLIRDIQNALRQPDQYGGDEQCLRSDTVNGAEDLLEIVESACAVSMRGNDRLVLDSDAALVDVRFSVCIRHADEQINLAEPVAGTGNVVPHLHDPGIEIRLEGRAPKLKIAYQATAHRVGVRLQPVVVVAGLGDCADRFVERRRHPG